jgi:hypothetical protein
MSNEVQAALIAAIVALITTAIGGYFTWKQIQREKTKWLIDLKTSYSVELYKTRLTSYSPIFEILGRLSKHATERLTPDKAQHIGHEIHEWLYSPGGLCADASTRGALKGLRYYCLEWKQGERPQEIGDWRHMAMFLLRRDLDVTGIESFDPKDRESLLAKLRAEVKTFS